jgi:hypothetical protein
MTEQVWWSWIVKDPLLGKKNNIMQGLWYPGHEFDPAQCLRHFTHTCALSIESEWVTGARVEACVFGISNVLYGTRTAPKGLEMSREPTDPVTRRWVPLLLMSTVMHSSDRYQMITSLLPSRFLRYHNW